CSVDVRPEQNDLTRVVEPLIEPGAPVGRTNGMHLQTINEVSDGHDFVGQGAGAAKDPLTVQSSGFCIERHLVIVVDGKWDAVGETKLGRNRTALHVLLHL